MCVTELVAVLSGMSYISWGEVGQGQKITDHLNIPWLK